ncbi:MAG: hypothetical protein RIT24_1631, partial [Planctomycetota bacterium]
MQRSLVPFPFFAIAACVGGMVALFAGCESGIQRLDRTTNERLRESAEALGGGAVYPELDPKRYEPGSYFPDFPDNASNPATTNPASTELSFESVPPIKEDASTITSRFERMSEDDPNARLLTFDDAVAYALGHAQEYLTAEETYILVAIRLLIEERRWQLIPGNVTSLGYTADGGGSRFNNALSVVNELGVSQRLPFGGQIGAAFAAQMTQQLDDYLNSNETQSASVVFEASIPLLRGFGDVAQEDLIQAKRNLVYAARNF